MKTHIMLVDDDKDELIFFLDALKEVPSEDGFKCTYANSAKQAAEMLKYLVPDFIFADFKMPGTNGLQLLLAIKNQLGSGKPKVYLYSIFESEKIKKAALNLGASGVIKKMYSIKALSKELIAVLKSPVTPAYVFSGGE
jgi:DNA-binding response OmpR family regulator